MSSRKVISMKVDDLLYSPLRWLYAPCVELDEEHDDKHDQ